MDYDTDEKSMATLRRQLRIAKAEYYRSKSEYMNFVMEALELEDTLKSYEHRDATGWKYISSFMPERPGKIGLCLDRVELVWRCIMRKQLKKLSAIILGCMTAAILLAEATILPSGVDFSLFSILINAVQTNEVLVQIDFLLTYSKSNKFSQPFDDMLVARYAPPISYNFLNLINLPRNATTVFERRMGKIDDAVPFFGQNFNRIYPLIMVVYTVMVASNFFDRIMSYFGNWKIFRLGNEDEADDLDGFDPSGLMILQKERSSISRGHKVGEFVIPLARYFNDTTTDIESGSNNMFASNSNSTLSIEEGTSNKYKALRTGQTVTQPSSDINVATDTDPIMRNEQQSRITSTWMSMKTNLQNFKSNMAARRFMPLRQSQDLQESQHQDSSESLDEIFARITKAPRNDSEDLDSYAVGPSRHGR
ncbi:hypothetical protein M8C21_010814 [Ambrosia artemisiifolia]|uniref:Uncharacterized protein n=1 Tax=Ambrosia artemisiifolia TaxID=4212 RepID=A0AAD5D568_AMBAR|nr:hypothetical protein M8C21_010814 [Ambrosia artemisiifolia]